MVKAYAPAPALTEPLEELPLDESAELDEEDLAALRAVIAEGRAAIGRGEYHSAEEVLAELDEEDRRAGD
jgi:hypothetical protein